MWPIFVQMIILSLMFIGGMGGSTTGGLKIIRIILLGKYTALETQKNASLKSSNPSKNWKTVNCRRCG